MRPIRKKSSSQDSSFTVQQGALMAAFFVVLAVTLQASPPAWWTSTGALNGNPANNYRVVNQGQLKLFTKKAVGYLDTNLPGGAGPTLHSMVAGWSNYYAANGYSATNPAPQDFKAINQGQLKSIASLIYGQLASAGYTNLYPSWIVANTNSDYMVVNAGQLKKVFAFDLSLAGPTSLTASANTSGTINLSWTVPSGNQATSYLLEQQNVDGSWSTLANLTNFSVTNYAVTGLSTGEHPSFQIIALTSTNASVATATPSDPGLVFPTNMHARPGYAAGEIDLTWDNQPSDATYIQVQQSPDGVHWTTISTLSNTASSYAVTNLTAGQAYYFALGVGNN